MIGAVHVAVHEKTREIGRLVVAPDQQSRGVGWALMEHLYEHAPAEVERFELFAGHRSIANLGLYQRLGYTEFERRPLTPTVDLLYLERPRTM
jgi:ribosomal protein S18 acetylase RimI-like enzyme